MLHSPLPLPKASPQQTAREPLYEKAVSILCATNELGRSVGFPPHARKQLERAECDLVRVIHAIYGN